MIFYEEYARSRAPARVAVVGEELLGPTLIAFGTPEQQRRFLPPIAAVEELWCQGYSEPGAGSDLAAVATTAVPDGDEWVITGQKVWTSLAHVADWCFVLARTEPGSRRSAGPVLPARADAAAGGHGPADPAADRDVGVQRGVLRRRADGARPRGRRARRRLADREGDAGVRARGGHARAAGRVPARARRAHQARAADRGRSGSAVARPARPGLDRSRGHPGVRARHSGASRPGDRGRGLGAEGAVVAVASGARGAGDGRARRRLDGRRAPTTPATWTSGSGCSCSAGRRPSTAGPTRSSGTSSPTRALGLPGRHAA